MKSEAAAQPVAHPSKRFVFEAKSAQRAPLEGLSWKLQVVVFVAAVLLIISRRPDAVTNPQFFGEDGTVWFPQAYMFGWLSALTHWQNGYFQTLPRIVSSIALLVPLRFAPLLMNAIGIGLQALPVTILLSARCRNWAPLNVRAMMAFAYIALPNTFELNAAIEEGQWHLALAACMLVLATVPTKLWQRIFDIGVILLSGFSGPFSVLLLPVAAAFWWFRRERWRLAVTGTLALTAAIQVSALIPNASATRPHVGLGATPKLFVQLLSGQVYLGALLGTTTPNTGRSARLLFLVAVLGTLLVVYCLIRARLEFKLAVAFAFLVFAASLHNPMVSMTRPQWEVLRDAPGIRYWFFPMIGFAWALIWCLTLSRAWTIRALAATGAIAMISGIMHDWQYPAYPDLHFPRYARQFEAAAPGTLIAIPIEPVGWTMRLTKRAPHCDAMPVGRMDLPPNGATISGSSTVAAGWVTANKPIQQVTISIDHKPAQITKPATARPDVDAIYPQSAVKNKGWAAILDISKVAPGSHEVEARAVEQNGCDAEFDLTTIQRMK